MVVQRLLLLAVLLLALTGCDLLNFGQSYVDKTLWPLQVAIEHYMERQAAAPPVQAPAGESTVAGHTATPVTDEHLPEDNSGHGDTPAPDTHGEDNTAVEHGSTDTPSEPDTPVTDTDHSPTAGEPHGINSESHDNDEEQTRQIPVVVVAVVDSHYLRPAGEEDEEQAAAQVVDAQRRERVVRREIHNALVANSLMQALPSDESNEALARQSIIANNSASLSKELCATIGTALGAEVIICVLIDREGAEVNVAAQVTATGEMIYQDALTDWEPAVNAIEQEPVE